MIDSLRSIWLLESSLAFNISLFSLAQRFLLGSTIMFARERKGGLLLLCPFFCVFAFSISSCPFTRIGGG